MKKCSSCGRNLPLEDFGVSRTAKAGRSSRCKQCNREAATRHYEKRYGTHQDRKSKQTALYNYIVRLKQEGHSLKQIAELVGLDKSSISYYLSGKRKVGTAAVKKFDRQQ